MRGSSRSAPRTAEVTVRAPGLRTPRIVMHVCSALSTTADASRRELALEPVGDLHRHALLQLQVAGEGLDHPRELRDPDDRLAGMYATWASPPNGSRWCMHSDENEIPRTSTSSS